MADAPSTLRLFVAIELPDEVRRVLRRQMEDLRERFSGVSWTRPANLHLTLRFLGDVSTGHLPDLQAELQRGLESIAPFPLEVAGLGAFPNTRRPSVLWAGVPDPHERLFVVQGAAESAAIAIGCESERRRFTPHITLGRVRRSRSGPWAEGLREAAVRPAGGFTVFAVSLFSSTLTPAGAQHTRIADFALATS